jgi:response regulator RpfG family c-di-GMP phosphodiesterase
MFPLTWPSHNIRTTSHRCQTSEDVVSAKQLLDVHAFDIVIIDITMFGESGIDLLRHVSINHPGTPGILVFVIDNPDEARKALVIGVYEYIVKPFTRNIVLINVEKVLRRHRLEMREKKHLHNLARRWMLPQPLDLAIRHHHGDIAQNMDGTLAGLVAIADCLFNVMEGNPGHRLGVDVVAAAIRDPVLRVLKDSDRWFPQVKTEMASACDFFIKR